MDAQVGSVARKFSRPTAWASDQGALEKASELQLSNPDSSGTFGTILDHGTGGPTAMHIGGFGRRIGGEHRGCEQNGFESQPRL